MTTPGDRDARSGSAAAVALILAGTPADLLLIRRAESPFDPWSGHMALPGGRGDPSDQDSIATAIRETFEEVGVELDRDAHVHSLAPLEARGRGLRVGFPVVAHVFRLPARPVAFPNQEVAEVVWAPLYALEVPSVLLENGWGPSVEIGGQVVWGLTYRIVEEFLKIRRNFQDI